ncbi:hypothetical protein D918_09885 [Trichuris suis]|nr:hypothetical protein D918_09885 [Trichuris suis]
MDTHGTGGFFDLKLIPQFDGSHGQSVVEWLQTVELICKLRKVEDVASVIPLRLIGGALAVYLQLSDKERESVEKLKASLLAAFAVDPFVAYEQFKERNLRANELPDVFLADLRRLASLFGGIPEKAVACAFVSGLPDNVRQPLRAGARMEDLSLNQILTRARAIIADDQGSQESSPYAAGDAVWVKPPGIRCDRRYQTGTVTDVISSQAVEVDGFPRHVRDLRPRAPVVDSTSALEDSQDDEIILTFPTRSETAETPSGQIDDPPEQEPRKRNVVVSVKYFKRMDGLSDLLLFFYVATRYQEISFSKGPIVSHSMECKMLHPIDLF